MNYLFQYGIILTITLVGELIKSVVPLPVPASIWGLLIMLLLLATNVLKLDQIKASGDFLVSMMPVMFVPPLVGLLNLRAYLQRLFVPLVLIVTIGTIIVMVTSGLVTQKLIKIKETKDE